MGLRPAEREFLAASVDAQVAERREREVVERRSADAEARAQRRTRQLAIAALVVALVGALATFAWVQRDDARRAEADLADTQTAQRLAASSLATLADDPELSLLVAMEAVRTTSGHGYALPEAIDATHWALQALGVQYPVTADTATAARFGPSGVRGVWVLPVDELMALAESASDRRLTADECRRYVGADCPAEPANVSGVEYLGGRDAYAQLVPLDQAEVVVGVPIDGGESDVEEWQRNLDAIAEQHGLRLRLQQLPTTGSLRDTVARSTEADVYVIDPRGLPDLLGERRLVDVRSFLDEAALVDDYGAHLVSLSRVADDGTWPSDTGPVYGVFADAQSKAVVWTDDAELTDLDDRTPGDWASFVSLADSIVADGRTPFCLGLESGDADGWPATDWVEMAVLRAAGPDLYDAWVDHAVPFDHPAVVDAIATVGAMVHRPGFLDVSPAQAAEREFTAAMVDLVDGTGRCLMVPMPSFMPAFVELPADQPVGVLPFPGFEAGYDDAMVGGAWLAVAVTDRPEVRALVSALASPDWGVGSAALAWPLRPPANARFDPDDMVNPVMAEIVRGHQAAIRSGTFRFDASDLMPTEVEAAFRAGMVRLFREGSPETVDELAAEIAADVEATWRRVEAPDG
jgi:alpha-glucoside transport system substrate-binding protein